MNSTLKTILAFCLGIIVTNYLAFDLGKDKGMKAARDEVERERAEWVAKVEKSQTEFEAYKKSIENKHRIETEDYKRRITTLRENPKVITKYITKEVKVPCSFELLHDRLVDGVPIDTMIPDKYKCSKEHDLTEVSKVMAENYGNCRLAMSRLDALQKVVAEYIKEQERLKGGGK